MAEAIGIVASTLTIAGLFKTCLDAFDAIEAARTQELDFHKAVLRLNIEKCRLFTWGQKMGLTALPEASHPRPLDSFEFTPLVLETLQIFLLLFSDTATLQARYGCCEQSQVASTADVTFVEQSTSHIQNLSACFKRFSPNATRVDTSIKRKVRWVVRDRKKFLGLVAEVKCLIDGLLDITEFISSAVAQSQSICSKIQRLQQPETLQLVAEVCETDHPAISEAASLRSEALSMSQTQRHEIDQWISDIDYRQSTVAELESLTVTELKHLVYRYAPREVSATPHNEFPVFRVMLRIARTNPRTRPPLIPQLFQLVVVCFLVWLQEIAFPTLPLLLFACTIDWRLYIRSHKISDFLIPVPRGSLPFLPERHEILRVPKGLIAGAGLMLMAEIHPLKISSTGMGLMLMAEIHLRISTAIATRP